MTRSRFIAVCVSLLGLLIACGTMDAQGKGPKGPKGDKGDKGDKGKNSVPGIRWEYTATTKEGNAIEAGTFRAEGRKLYQGAKQVGTFDKAGQSEYNLDITEGKLKGKIELKLVRKDPRPVYRGEWDMAGGGKAHISVKFLED